MSRSDDHYTPRAPRQAQTERPRRPRYLSFPPTLGGAIRHMLLALLVVVVLVGVVGVFTLYQLTATRTAYPAAHFNRGQNALWLEHSWAGDAHSAAEYDALAVQLNREQIAYVFVHVGPLNGDGTLPAARSTHATELAQALHTRMPKLKVLAWIGQLAAASGAPADEVLHMSQATTRERIASNSAQFVVAHQFDGVHYDIEPITNGNQSFLKLLTETRALLPHGVLLSVSAQKWPPNAFVADMLYRTAHAGQWTTSYMAQVAALVDQMAVMTYDTAMPTAAAYRLVMKQETQHILAAIESVPHPPQLLIGVPTYSGNTSYFHDSAENISSALAGVTAGLNSASNTQPFLGIAVYRYGTTSDAEWATYSRTWLGATGQG